MFLIVNKLQDSILLIVYHYQMKNRQKLYSAALTRYLNVKTFYNLLIKRSFKVPYPLFTRVSVFIIIYQHFYVLDAVEPLFNIIF